MRTRTTISGLLKATFLGLAVALLNYYGLLAYIRWQRDLPTWARMFTLAAGGSVFFTFGAGVIFSAETGRSMRRMPILRVYATCFLLLMAMFMAKMLLNRFF